MKRRTLYDLLNLPKDASQPAIRAAYLKKAKTLHPDVNPTGDTQFKALKEAYAVLSDPQKRPVYDSTLASVLRPQSGLAPEDWQAVWAQKKEGNPGETPGDPGEAPQVSRNWRALHQLAGTLPYLIPLLVAWSLWTSRPEQNHQGCLIFDPEGRAYLIDPLTGLTRRQPAQDKVSFA